jgi:hypothetical protein
MNDQQLPKKRMGCFGQGCIALVIIVLFVVVVGGGGGWWLYNKAVDSLTSDHPTSVAIDQPSDMAFQQAETKMRQLRNAIRNKTDTTIAFSAADLNALIARDPGFAGTRGKTRVDMAGNDLILDLSGPLDTIKLPKLQGRWFNGRAQFGFAYDLGEFSFVAHSLETNGHRMVNASFLRNFSSSYTRSFNKSFHNALGKNPQGSEFWNRVKGMSVQNGQLEVITKSGG